jgi:hypothetical protein
MPVIKEWHPPSTLLEKTVHLLKTRKVSCNQIFLDTKLPPNWIWCVEIGRIKAPSVQRIQKLYEYLSGKKLKI